MARLHQSQIWDQIQEKVRGKYKPFSFTYAKSDGSLETYRDAVFSSIHSKGSTINLFVNGDNVTPHTFRRICFTEFNDFKLYI